MPETSPVITALFRTAVPVDIRSYVVNVFAITAFGNSPRFKAIILLSTSEKLLLTLVNANLMLSPLPALALDPVFIFKIDIEIPWCIRDI